ncbi:hypothetical protein BH09MYX1_BH09MYX1_61520 [soil metagenome]
MQRRLLALVALLMLVLVAPLAHAGGSFRLRSNEAQEVSGAWHLFVSIDLAAAPSLAHVPMKFLFTKQVVYERALVDGQKDPVLNRQVLNNQMPQILSMDVDFADGTGKVFKTTRFDFGVTRQLGFEAGEYKLQLRMSDGTDVGAPVQVTLKGDNPTVDRRSIAFNANDHGIKKVDNGIDGGAKTAQNDTGPAATSQEVQPSGSAAPFIDPSAFNKTDEETVKEKPGGCGCVVAGVGTMETGAVALPLVGLAALVLRRRRRGGRASSRT